MHLLVRWVVWNGPDEFMLQCMCTSHVAGHTEVVVIAPCTLPQHATDRLILAPIAPLFMFNACKKVDRVLLHAYYMSVDKPSCRGVASQLYVTWVIQTTGRGWTHAYYTSVDKALLCEPFDGLSCMQQQSHLPIIPSTADEAWYWPIYILHTA